MKNKVIYCSLLQEAIKGAKHFVLACEDMEVFFFFVMFLTDVDGYVVFLHENVFKISLKFITLVR